VLSNPNALNPDVFLIADVFFNTPSGTAQVTLSATIDETTGGFFIVPEPSLLLPLAAAVLFLLWKRRAIR
jgi:hypothetical protein